MSDNIFPYTTSALRVDQRLGTFYAVVLPAELLLQVSTSDRMSAIMDENGNGYELDGTQRITKDSRLTEIANYINRIDSTFPNSIILAANHNLEEGFDQGEVEDILEETDKSQNNSHVWTVSKSKNDNYTMTIPSSEKLAAIIDGQHRLFSFAKADIEAMKDTHLLCSVFLDLPKPIQAQIFATINSTQKRVDRSLTYELFGYNVSDEDEKFWAPDKLAVFLTRRLATDPESSLKGKIKVAPKQDAKLKELTSGAEWYVSTSVVVDGILRLFSSKPKNDADVMRAQEKSSREVFSIGRVDNSPLRDEFIKGNDLLIYTMILNYLKACNEVFWESYSARSLIVKTVGVQAIFDILRLIAKDALDAQNISVEYFLERLEGVRENKFSRVDFDASSGAGRTSIRKAIEEAIGLNDEKNV